MSDLVTFGETMLRLSPPGHDRIEAASEFEVRAAGAESNVAVAANRLGADATWMSKVPQSPLGRRVVGEVEQYGLDTSVVWSQSGRQGAIYQETAGKPRGTNIVYDRDGAAITTASADEFDVTEIESARVFFTSGITPALSDTLKETTVDMLNAARQAGTTTAFDVNFRSKLWSAEEARETLTKLFPGIDILTVAVRDARDVLGFEVEPRQIAHKLGSQYDFTTVIVTSGDRGALAWHDNVVHDQEAFESDTTDPVGSGDAFTGAFIARRTAGDDVPRALKYATATAALARTIPGDVALVTQDEVEELVFEGVQAIHR